MSEQEFADMFEHYAKTRRGIKFLTGYFQTMFKHCVIEHEENECGRRSGSLKRKEIAGEKFIFLKI